MEKRSVILVTGAAGFIGSCMIQYLNEQGLENLILVDKFRHTEKEGAGSCGNWVARARRRSRETF